MKHKYHATFKYASLAVVLIVLTGALTGCGLRDAIVGGFFDAIGDAVSTIVSDTLLLGD